MAPTPRRRTFACPHCGARVPIGALACPACGSDANSGWSEDADAWSGDLPAGYGDDDFDDDDYEEFLADEGLVSGAPPSRRALRRRWVALVAAVLIACLLIWLVRR